MAIQTTDWIWKNGELIPWASATTHVMSHALHYGTAVFEGVRVYSTPKGPAIFRLSEHSQRLINSAKIYRFPLKYTVEELNTAQKLVITSNKLQSAYIRPLAYYGYGDLGVTPSKDTPLDVIIAAFPWGRYLGPEALEQGVDACISSWNRAAPNTFPSGAKAAGNYLNSLLVGLEARERGFAEGIALAPDGRLSEGAGENLFLVMGDVIKTPSASSSILQGITRDTVIKLAKQLGYTVVEEQISREALYVADEVFMTGTAAEITPVRSVDRIQVGSGARGPVTHALQDAFFGLFEGRTPDPHGWLDYVEA